MNEILSFSDTQIQEMIHRVDNETLLAALRDESKAVRFKVMQHFSHRALELFIEDSAKPETLALTPEQVNKAKAKVMAILLRGRQ